MLDDLVPSATTLREARPRIQSALPLDVKEAHYDARAAAYDRSMGSAFYNRLLWGAYLERCRAYLRLLHWAGEVAVPRCFDEMQEEVESGLGAAVDGAREGCMAFLTARVGSDAS